MFKVAKTAISCLLWPFLLPFRLVAFLTRAIGRLVMIVLGMGLIIIGAAMSVTVAGAMIGVPLILLGFLLMLRGLL